MPTLFDCFERVASDLPDHIAVREATRTWTYARLLARANAIAAQLDERGAGERVACLLSHGGEMIAAILGVLAGGRAYVPIDPTHPADRSTFVLADSGTTMILHDGAQAALATQLAGDLPLVCVDDAIEGRLPARRPDPDTLAYCLYTSGSTGRPKGVPQVHANVVHFIDAYRRRLEIEPTDALSLLSTFAFDAAVVDVFSALLSGATLCPFELREEGFSGLSTMLVDRGVTIYHSTPTVFRELTQQGLRLSSRVRAVVLGGEEVRAADVTRFRAACAPGAVLVNGYGMTECSWALINVIRPGDPNDRETVPLGTPIDGVRVRLVPAHDEPVAAEGFGTIVIESAHVAGRYWQRPEETAAAFPSPGVFVTTDYGRVISDGRIEFAGRKASHVKLRGYRIDLREIESVVLTHPGVREAAVVLRETSRGEELVAYIAGEQAPDLAALRAHLSTTLPVHMVPTAMVQMAALPRGATNKLDRRALPLPDLTPTTTGFVAPRSSTEETLAQIWQGVLGVERVGAHDDFFALGGHSLKILRVIAGIRKALGVELGFRTMFQTPTLAELARAVDAAPHTTDGGLAFHAPPRPARPGLSFAQQRMWFLQQLAPDSTAFQMESVRRHRGLDIERLRRSFDLLVQRHEPLRTTFPAVEGEPYQHVHPSGPWLLEQADLQALDADARVTALDRIVAGQRAPFDLATGPLLRTLLVHTGLDEHVLIVTLHHILTDVGSQGVFWRDLWSFYDALGTGRDAELPPLFVQYADYAAWQRNVLAGQERDRHLSYWIDHLRGAPAETTLPLAGPRPPVQTDHAREVTLTLDPALTRQLRALSHRMRASLFMTLTASLRTLLARYTLTPDVLLGTLISDRNVDELEGLIGMFANPLVLRNELRPDDTFSTLLARERENALAAYEHQQLPFELIVDALGGQRRLDRHPVFQVQFVHQNDGTMNLRGEPIAVETPHNVHLDLSIQSWEHDDRISLTFRYNVALFDAAAIEGLVRHYQRTVERIVSDADLRLDTLELSNPNARAPRSHGRAIVVAATFTADPLVDPLTLWFDKLQLPAAVELAPYNQVFQELLDPASTVGRTDAKGFNVLLIRFEDWTGVPYEQAAEIEEFSADALASVDATTQEMIAALTAAAKRSAATFMVCVAPMSKAAHTDPAFVRECARWEEKLVSAFSSTSNVRIVPSSETIAVDYDDAESNRLGHLPYTPAYFATLGTLIARRIYRLVMPPKKVIALDADQTLWRGVCGEDGPDGVVLDEPHLALQRFMIERSKAGMLLCLCSKNNEEDVAEVFARRSEMPLQRQHLVARRVNWQPKSMNLQSLAKELSLGLDSFILVDDDPAVCAEVEANCPEVLTLRIPTDETLPRFLDNVWAFDSAPATEEDAKRTALYQQNAERSRLQDRSSSFADFLANLELRITIAPMRPDQQPRVAQLTTRTNQFNTTTIRRTERDLEASGLECITVDVADRFGDYGLVGVVLYRAVADALVADSMLLSCRALGRGVEHRMLARLGEIAKQRGLARVDVPFVKSAKNAPALGFLDSTGQAYLATGPDGDTYRYPTEIAAALAFVPGDTVPGVPRDEAKPSSVRAAMAPWSDIARDLYDASRVMDAVAAANQVRVDSREIQYVAPRTSLEETVAQIWSEFLGGQRIGVHDEFFTLGGNSLLTIRVIARLRRELAVELPVRALFEAPTVAGLAALIEQSRADGSDSVIERPTLHASATRRTRLPPALRGVFKLDKLMNTDLFARHVWSSWIEGPLDLGSLERAVATMRIRHALLRTRFFFDDDREMLEVLDPAAVERFALIQHADLTSLSETDQEQADAEFHRRMCLRPLDLGHGEVMSVALSRLSATRHRLTLSIHNIVADFESLTTYLDEVCELWRAFATAPDRDPVDVLPPTPLQYHHLAHYLERVHESEVGRVHRAFWQSQVRGLEPLVLPIDSPREAVDARRDAQAGIASFPSASVMSEIPNQVLTVIERIADSQRASVMSTLVAALAGYLSERTSQRDVAFITRLSHRYHPGLERALGFLVNPILLRISTEGAPAFPELVRRTHAVVTDAFDHGEGDLFELGVYSAFRFCVVYVRDETTGDSSLSFPPANRATRAPHPGGSGEVRIGYDLILWLIEQDGRVKLRLAYNLELFRDSTAVAFLAGFATFVSAACANYSG